MIDIHCHILPGVDDGPQTMEESLAMARMAVADGIRGAVCTPHWHPMIWPNEKVGIHAAVNELQVRLAQHGIDFDLWAGSELSLDSELHNGLEGGRLNTLNRGKWILLELPGTYPPPGIDDYLWSFRQRGYEIVLAHPERFAYIQNDPARLHAWVEMGMTVQITASSLLGRLGPDISGLCRTLLEHHLVHFLATDSHGVRARRPMLRAAVQAAAEVVGEAEAARLVENHPTAVVQNESLDLSDFAPIALPPKKKSIFSFFRRKR